MSRLNVTKVPYQEHLPPDLTACIFWTRYQRAEQFARLSRCGRNCGPCSPREEVGPFDPRDSRA